MIRSTDTDRLHAHRSRHPRQRRERARPASGARTRASVMCGRNGRPSTSKPSCSQASSRSWCSSSSRGSCSTPIHTTRARRKFGKAPTSRTDISSAAVPGRRAIAGLDQLRRRRLVHVAEKLQRQMALLATDPRQLRRLGAQRSRISLPAGRAARRRSSIAKKRRIGSSFTGAPPIRRQLDRDVREPVRARERERRRVSSPPTGAPPRSPVRAAATRGHRAPRASTAPPARRSPRPAPLRSAPVRSPRSALASRGHAVEHVQRPRAEAAQIERDARESRGEHAPHAATRSARAPASAAARRRRARRAPGRRDTAPAGRRRCRVPAAPPPRARSARGASRVTAVPYGSRDERQGDDGCRHVGNAERAASASRMSLLREPELGERTRRRRARERPARPAGNRRGRRRSCRRRRCRSRARGRPARACSRAPSCRSSSDCSGWPRTAGRSSSSVSSSSTGTSNDSRDARAPSPTARRDRTRFGR